MTAPTPQEYCQRCFAALPSRAMRCPGCGRHLPLYRWLWGFGLLALCFGLAFVAALWDEHSFNAMTPPQHLSSAKAELDDKDAWRLSEGLRHARAVPAGSPQAADAEETATKLQDRLCACPLG